MTRAGATLLESLVAEERRGLPGAALAAAEAAGGAPEHLLDAACALLVAGEPRAAGRVLDRASAAGGGAVVDRRIQACRSWADQLDRNWYPGDTGAEIESVLPVLLGDRPDAGDAKTMLLEVCVTSGPLPLLSTRALLETFVREETAAIGSVLGSGLQQLQQFQATVEAAGAGRSAGWAVGAQADLAWRCGFAPDAEQLLEGARSFYARTSDPVGLACTHLVEGDWYAAPGSSPEALGFALAEQNLPSPREAARDLARAVRCYEQAAALLVGTPGPRAAGATALRRGGTAGRVGPSAAV